MFNNFSRGVFQVWSGLPSVVSVTDPRSMLFVVFGSLSLLYVLSISPWFTGSDDAAYLILAKSLASGKGYADLSLPGSPRELHWPIGLPLVLAPIWWLSPNLLDQLWFFQIAIATFSIVAMLFGYYYFVAVTAADRLSIGHTQIIAVILLTGFAPYSVIFASKLICTEALYSMFSLGALLALQRYARKPLFSPWLLVVCGSLVAAYLTRTIGLTLIASACISFLLRREFKRFLFLCVVISLLLFPFVYRNTLAGSGLLLGNYLQDDALIAVNYSDPEGEYVRSIYQVVKRAGENAGIHIRQNIPLLLFPLLFGPRPMELLQAVEGLFVVDFLGLFLTISIGAGYVVVARYDTVLALYVPLYLTGILSVSFATPRLLMPVLCILILCLIIGIQMLIRGITGVRYPYFPVSLVVSAFVAIILLGFLVSGRHLWIEGVNYWSQSADRVGRFAAIVESADWLDTQTSSDSIVAAQQHRVVYLLTNRKAIPLPSLDEIDRARWAAGYGFGNLYILLQPFVPPANDPQAIYGEDPEISIHIERQVDTYSLRYASSAVPAVSVYAVLPPIHDQQNDIQR